MKEVSLSGSVRQGVGKKDAKAVRNEGRVPAVVYGAGDQVHFSVKHTDMEKLVYTPNVYRIKLELDGDSRSAIIQEVQHHPVTDRIQHVDFVQLVDDRKVRVEIPVNLMGRPIGVMNGGRLAPIFRKLTVYALPGNLPDAIDVDISDLRIGQSIRVSDLITEELNILNAPNAVVVSVKMARGAVDEEEEGEEGEGEGGEESAEGDAEGGEGGE